jgi:hypothetical protein
VLAWAGRGVCGVPPYRFLLMLENGEAADPPAFISDEPDWNVGDTFVAGGRRFRILKISDREIAEVTAHIFDALWTVEELPR